MTNEKSMANKDADFLNQYLESLEKKDSREGASKWLMLAAIGAVLWQLSNVFFGANINLIIEIVGIFLALYFWVEFCPVILSVEGGASALRFLPRHGKGAEAKLIGALFVRWFITGIIFVFFFDGVEKYIRYSIAYMPLFFAAICLYGMLDLRDKYSVQKPYRSSVVSCVLGFLLLLAPMAVGIFLLFQNYDALNVLTNNLNIKSIQSAGLIVVLLILLEKYARMLRVDGEISAVRRIWRRRGIGELSHEDAENELRLIVAGAGLSEVISQEVSALSEQLQDIERLEGSSKQELIRFFEKDGSEDSVTKSALKNSLEKRIVDMNQALSKMDDQCAEILTGIKKLISDETWSNPEARDLKNSLEERVKMRRSVAEGLVAEIRSGIESA